MVTEFFAAEHAIPPSQCLWSLGGLPGEVYSQRTDTLGSGLGGGVTHFCNQFEHCNLQGEKVLRLGEPACESRTGRAVPNRDSQYHPWAYSGLDVLDRTADANDLLVPAVSTLSSSIACGGASSGSSNGRQVPSWLGNRCRTSSCRRGRPCPRHTPRVSLQTRLPCPLQRRLGGHCR